MEFTEQDANELLLALSEFPIKFLPVVVKVKEFFEQKFAADAKARQDAVKAHYPGDDEKRSALTNGAAITPEQTLRHLESVIQPT
jgi:hypothetical protein